MQRDYVPLFRSICTSDKLADLPDHDSRLFYVLLLSQCDSWGRIADSPRALCAAVWGMFGGTVKATSKVLDELCKVGLIERHSADGLSWIQVTKWESYAGSIGHPDRRGKSKFPGPSPDSVRSSQDSFRSTPTQPDMPLDQVPSEQNRSEQSRTEQSKTEARVRAAASPLDLDGLVTGTCLDTPQMRLGLEEWIRYKKERKQAYTASGLRALVAQLASWGPQKAAESIRTSMASNWAGLFEVQPQRFPGASEPKGFQGIRDYLDLSKGGAS